MSKFLKTSNYCIDLETVLWVSDANRDFYGVLRNDKFMEKTKDEYKSYPINFDAKKRELTYYSINEVDSTNTSNTGRHAYKYEFPIVMQEFEIQKDYIVDERETEKILILENSKNVEADSLIVLNKIKEKIFSSTNFIEITPTNPLEVLRPFPIHSVECLIVNPAYIYFIDKSKQTIVINFRIQNEFDRSIAIGFQSKEEADEAYNKLIKVLTDK